MVTPPSASACSRQARIRDCETANMPAQRSWPNPADSLPWRNDCEDRAGIELRALTVRIDVGTCQLPRTRIQIERMSPEINRSASRSDNGFPPVTVMNAEALILGSLPGRKSLEMQQYYAHPQNSFWKLIARIYDADPSLPYMQRVEILTANRIAL